MLVCLVFVSKRGNTKTINFDDLVAVKRTKHLTKCVPVTQYGVDDRGHNRFRKWLVACSVPSHYLNKCWRIVNRILMNKFKWDFNKTKNTHNSIQKSEFKNVVWAMSVIFQASMCYQTTWWPLISRAEKHQAGRWSVGVIFRCKHWILTSDVNISTRMLSSLIWSLVNMYHRSVEFIHVENPFQTTLCYQLCYLFQHILNAFKYANPLNLQMRARACFIQMIQWNEMKKHTFLTPTLIKELQLMEDAAILIIYTTYQENTWSCVIGISIYRVLLWKDLQIFTQPTTTTTSQNRRLRCVHQGSVLVRRINFDSSMDK